MLLNSILKNLPSIISAYCYLPAYLSTLENVLSIQDASLLQCVVYIRHVWPPKSKVEQLVGLCLNHRCRV